VRTRNASEVGAAGERKWTKWRVLWIETWLCVREEREVAVCQGHGLLVRGKCDREIPCHEVIP
jgi:hypothetical protein